MKDYDFNVRQTASTEQERRRQQQQLSMLKKKARLLFEELAKYQEIVDSAEVCIETALKMTKLTTDYRTAVHSMARIYDFTVKRRSLAEWEELRKNATQESKSAKPTD